MKKIIIFLILLTLCVNAELSLKQIQDMVIKIHEKREGIKLSTLENTKEPFVRLEEDENNITTFVIPRKEKVLDATDVKMELHAVVNGKAYINNKWVNIDEQVLGYTLGYIGKRGVVLRNGNVIRKLFLRKYRDNSFIKLKKR
ncbi:MAG: hypothetical protein QM493_05795 [Sulfurovum sp.]